MRKLQALWQALWADVDRRVHSGRVLGLIFLIAGFVVIGKAWDGAASLNYLPAQFPYLLSGGFLGLGLVVVGSALLFLSTVRAERQELTRRLDDMAELLGRNLSRLGATSNGRGGAVGEVVAGEGAYHRPECRLLKGKHGLVGISLEQAGAEGLDPCRVCEPPVRKDEAAEAAEGTPVR